MKRVILLAILCSSVVVGVSAPGTAHATDVGSGRNFGLGFALGSPTSIVGKYFLGYGNALDFGLGFWRYGRDCWDERGVRRCRGNSFDRVSINADYLWQETLAQGTAKLDWHIGAGGRIWIWDDYYDDDIALAARMPVGLDLTFARPDFLEIFLEIAPALYIIPDIGLDIEAFIGVRFYF